MRVKQLFLTILLFFLGVRPVFAVEVTISDVPQTINDQPFIFNVTVSGAQAGTNYLRANFSQIGKYNYFGYTYNGSSFTNSSTCTDYLAITIDSSGKWSGTVQAKIDTSSSYYIGSGDYSFKVRRYTKSCSSTSYLWSNEVITTVAISSPTPPPSPTPTSSPTPSLTPIPTPTPTSKPKTTTTTSNTPTPTINSTTPLSAPDTTPTSKSRISNTKASYQIASVAAAVASPIPSAKVEIKSQKQTNYFVWAGLILIFTGGLSIGYIYLRKNASIHITFRKRD